MILTKNSINDNDFFYSYDWHVLKMSHWVCISSGHIFVIVIRSTICHNVHHNELFLPRFIYENVDIMFIQEFGARKYFESDFLEVINFGL